MKEPLRLIAPCKDYLWGGNRLRTEFGKESESDIIAESWELSCHKDGTSVIAAGKYAGQPLTAYLAAAGKDVLGTRGTRFAEFPVLIKLIDARDNLSVQVHPDNDYARRVEGEPGKTEMWYIVDCTPGAQLIYGFQEEISQEEFRQRITDNTLLSVVSAVPVHPGDVFYIAAGTLHAIGAGILIAEIQQNSNTTYRVYDYGRVGADGKPRALHIDKAVEVTQRTPAKPYPRTAPVIKPGCTATRLSACDYFTVDKLDISGTATFCVDETAFQHLLMLSGCLTLSCGGKEYPMQKGDSLFLPAGLGDYALSGTGQLLFTTI